MRRLSPFGTRLRAHRKKRGMSQLDLALCAGTTPRYVSFIETGRSRPGRGVILRLAKALDLPLREQNVLLASSGLQSAFPERSLEEHAMEPIRRVVEQVLENHNPYPGMALGPGFVIVQMNRAAERLFPGIREMAIADIVARWFPGMDDSDADMPVMTPTLLIDGHPVRTITTVTRFDKALDVTTSELVVELIFPADASADAFFRDRAP